MVNLSIDWPSFFVSELNVLLQQVHLCVDGAIRFIHMVSIDTVDWLGVMHYKLECLDECMFLLFVDWL